MKTKANSASQVDLSARLTCLNDLNLKQLKERWQDLYASKAPPDISRQLLIRANPKSAPQSHGRSPFAWSKLKLGHIDDADRRATAAP